MTDELKGKIIKLNTTKTVDVPPPQGMPPADEFFMVTAEEGKVSLSIKGIEVKLHAKQAATLGLLLVIAAKNTFKKD